VAFSVQKLPVAVPADAVRGEVINCVRRLTQIAQSRQSTTRELLDWLSVQHSVEEPTAKLQFAVGLDSDLFAAEVRKARGKKSPLSLAALRSLREEHTETILPAQAVAKEALASERKISDLVNEAYGLTPEDVELMWATAPPRMPITGSSSS
jgi:hypothetical protein